MGFVVILAFFLETLSMLPCKGLPGGTSGKELACQCKTHRDLDYIPWLGRSPGGGHGNPLQYSCLENPRGQRCLAGHSSWGCKESDTAEQLSTAQQLPHYLLIYKMGQMYQISQSFLLPLQFSHFSEYTGKAGLSSKL